MKNSYDQISTLQGSIESLAQERNNLQSYAQQKDTETAQLRIDISKAFEKTQADLKAKDKELAAVRAENEGYRASGKILEQINLELKFDNEAKASQIRHQEEMIGKHELSISKTEAKLVRLTGDLDAAQTAKAQIEQSRSAMSSRIDAVSQALRGREVDGGRDRQVDQPARGSYRPVARHDRGAASAGLRARKGPRRAEERDGLLLCAGRDHEEA